MRIQGGVCHVKRFTFSSRLSQAVCKQFWQANHKISVAGGSYTKKPRLWYWGYLTRLHAKLYLNKACLLKNDSIDHRTLHPWKNVKSQSDGKRENCKYRYRPLELLCQSRTWTLQMSAGKANSPTYLTTDIKGKRGKWLVGTQIYGETAHRMRQPVGLLSVHTECFLPVLRTVLLGWRGKAHGCGRLNPAAGKMCSEC